MTKKLRRLSNMIKQIPINIAWSYHHYKAHGTPTSEEEAEQNRQELLRIMEEEPDMSKVRNPIED